MFITIDFSRFSSILAGLKLGSINLYPKFSNNSLIPVLLWADVNSKTAPISFAHSLTSSSLISSFSYKSHLFPAIPKTIFSPNYALIIFIKIKKIILL